LKEIGIISVISVKLKGRGIRERPISTRGDDGAGGEYNTSISNSVDGDVSCTYSCNVGVITTRRGLGGNYLIEGRGRSLKGEGILVSFDVYLGHVLGTHIQQRVSVLFPAGFVIGKVMNFIGNVHEYTRIYIPYRRLCNLCTLYECNVGRVGYSDLVTLECSSRAFCYLYVAILHRYVTTIYVGNSLKDSGAITSK
jgi:hypothetical protein